MQITCCNFDNEFVIPRFHSAHQIIPNTKFKCQRDRQKEIHIKLNQLINMYRSQVVYAHSP